MSSDWHMFDVEHDYEVRQDPDGSGWQIRVKGSKSITHLTDEQFDQLRSEGENPKGLK